MLGASISIHFPTGEVPRPGVVAVSNPLVRPQRMNMPTRFLRVPLISHFRVPLISHATLFLSSVVSLFLFLFLSPLLAAFSPSDAHDEDLTCTTGRRSLQFP